MPIFQPPYTSPNPAFKHGNEVLESLR